MTTSAARCRLYGFLDQVVKNNGELLYMDTGTSINLEKITLFYLDSMIYKYRGQRPITLGNYLGDMVNEYPKHNVIEFVAGGCKNYCLRIRKKDDPNAADEYIIKVSHQKQKN